MRLVSSILLYKIQALILLLLAGSEGMVAAQDVSICDKAPTYRETPVSCDGSLVCFSVEKTPLVEEIYIDFTQDPDSYWTDPKPITKVAINGLYVARSLYNITKISTVRALVKLTVGGYVPANSTVAIRIAENNFTTPVFAHSTACGSLYGIGGGTRPDSLALFVRIGGVILAIVLLVFTFVDFSRGSIFQRSLLLDIMLHLRFVNIRPPGDLRQFFYYARTSNIAVVLPVNMFSSLGEQDQQVLPTNTKFHQYSTDTQFCLSFGIELGSLIVLVVLQMLFGLLSKLELDKISALGGFFRHCNRIFNCNLAMNLLLAYSLRAFIYILLNFRFLQLSSGLGMASFMLAVLMLLVYIILLGYTSTFIYKRRSAYLRGRFKGGDGALVLEWDYIQDSWLQRGYPVLSLVRSIVTAVILVFGQDNGLVQLVLLLSIQLFYLVYLSHQLPHRHGVDFAGQMIGEFMLVMILTSMFALESLNRYNYLNVQPGNTAAWICMMAIFMYVLYLLLQLMYELYLAWQKLGVYLARVERRQWKEEQQADEDVIIAQTLKGLFLAVLEYSASDPMPSSINSITDRTARELLQKQQEERFQAQEKIRAEEQARERAREQARNTTRARKALRQAFEWEVQNKVLDEMLDEVEDINIKKAEQTKIGIAEAESPDKAEQPSQNRLKSQSIRVKPAPSQGLDMSAKQWKEAAKLTDKVIQKANAQQRREKLRSKSLVREETRLPPQQTTNEGLGRIEGGSMLAQSTIMNAEGDNSFIESFLRELPKDRSSRRGRRRVSSSGSDAFGAQLDAESNQIRDSAHQQKLVAGYQASEQEQKLSSLATGRYKSQSGPDNHSMFDLVMQDPESNPADPNIATQSQYLSKKILSNPLYDYIRAKNSTQSFGS